MCKIKKIEMVNDINFNYTKNGSDVKKQEFLKTIILGDTPDNSVELYMSVLRNIVDKEEYKNRREWADFNQEMVDASLIELEAKSPVTLYSYLSLVKNYLSETTEQSENARTGYSYTMGLTIDDLKKFINEAASTDRYISPKEYNEIMDSKYVDVNIKVTVLLLYGGVKGTNYNDLCSITLKDIDFDKKRIYISAKDYYFNITEDQAKLIKSAIDTDVYTVYDAEGRIAQEKEFYSYQDYTEAGEPQWLCRRLTHHRNRNFQLAKGDTNIMCIRINDMRDSIGNQYLDPQSICISGEAYRLLQFTGFVQVRTKDWARYRKEYPNAKIGWNTARLVCEVIRKKIKED